MGFAMIGYMGFSNTYMTVDGARDLGMTNVWDVIGQYGGCVSPDWAYPSRPDFFGDCWKAFYDHGINGNPEPDAWWLHIGVHKTENVRFIETHTLRSKTWNAQGIYVTILKAIERLLAVANLPVYLSAVNGYEEGVEGFTAIAWRECAEAVSRVLALAEEVDAGLCFDHPFPDGAVILAGPVFPALTAADLGPDGIHPTNPAGRALLGQVLKDFPAFQP